MPRKRDIHGLALSDTEWDSVVDALVAAVRAGLPTAKDRTRIMRVLDRMVKARPAAPSTVRLQQHMGEEEQQQFKNLGPR